MWMWISFLCAGIKLVVTSPLSLQKQYWMLAVWLLLPCVHSLPSSVRSRTCRCCPAAVVRMKCDVCSPLPLLLQSNGSEYRLPSWFLYSKDKEIGICSTHLPFSALKSLKRLSAILISLTTQEQIHCLYRWGRGQGSCWRKRDTMRWHAEAYSSLRHCVPGKLCAAGSI